MSFEKIVKLACKPKAAPPKSKYMDPIIAATYDEEGAVSDVCRAISTRLREPNAIVVFKALIVVHTMLRNGATENVLGYMAKFDPLRLHNVGQGHWDGYRAPENLARYASYLESRIKAFRDLKHDAIRVQSESNRDHRVTLIEEGSSYFSSSGVSRSKTIVGRKLRVMAVEKGLLRETKIVQGMIDALVECRFYLDDLEDQLNITSLRMLVKDLLILFQACNEGVINVLENYFEMSHVDAETALDVYQRFCRQTEKVVDYLSVAKKLENLLNVPIPNLKHAPVSLVNALEEYLRDPNFEQNRLEYKANKAAADGKPPPNRRATKLTDKPVPSTSPPDPSPPSSSTVPPMPSKVEDFFASIEAEQSHMFSPGAESSTTNHFQQQAAFNPFAQRQSSLPFQMTGFPLGNGTVPVLSPQPPEFAQSPFGPIISVTPTGMPQQSGFLQPIPRSNPLQLQTTASNPFRQSILLPQHTGMQAFGGSSSGTNPFPRPASSMGLSAFGGGRVESPSFTTSSNALFGGAHRGLTPVTTVGSEINGKVHLVSNISRPASTPIRSTTLPVSTAQPIKSHQTGSRNPFGQPLPPPVPPVPKGPTLQQLATGAGWGSSFGTNNQGAPATSSLAPQPTSSTSSNDLIGSVNAQRTNAGLISSIASSFGAGQNDASGTSSSPFLSPNSSLSPPPVDANNSNLSPSLNVQPTPRPSFGTSLTSPPASTTPTGIASLQAQPTGFGGSSVRPFKPSSSFGASLMERLPPIPSEPGTPMPSSSTNGALPNVTGVGISSTNTSTAQTSPSGPLISNPTGLPNFGSSLSAGNGNAPTRDLSPLGVGLRPQPAGGALGGANPFRASMGVAGGTGGTIFSGFAAVSNTPISGFPSAFGSSNGAFNSTATGAPQPPSSFTGMEAFGTQFSNLGVGGGSAQNRPGGAPPNHQQQSLI